MRQSTIQISAIIFLFFSLQAQAAKVYLKFRDGTHVWMEQSVLDINAAREYGGMLKMLLDRRGTQGVKDDTSQTNAIEVDENGRLFVKYVADILNRGRGVYFPDLPTAKNTLSLCQELGLPNAVNYIERYIRILESGVKADPGVPEDEYSVQVGDKDFLLTREELQDFRALHFIVFPENPKFWPYYSAKDSLENSKRDEILDQVNPEILGEVLNWMRKKRDPACDHFEEWIGLLLKLDARSLVTGLAQFCKHSIPDKNVKRRFYNTNGDYYEGPYVNGLREGYGTYIYATAGDRYDGMWRAGQFEGHGVYSYKTGESYAGNWTNHKSKDQGTFTFAHGSQLKGTFSGEQSGLNDGMIWEVKVHGVLIPPGSQPNTPPRNYILRAESQPKGGSERKFILVPVD